MYKYSVGGECIHIPPIDVFEKSSVVKSELKPEEFPFIERSPMSENKL